MNLESLLRWPPALSGGGSEPHPPAEMADGSLVIDCRGCRLAPVPGSDECIRCMVESMCSTGGSDRVVLRTGRDIEVSGAAGRAVREVASVRRWSFPREALPVRCRSCPITRARLMETAWSAFPRSGTAEARRMIAESGQSGDGCADCMARSANALDQVDAGIARAVRMMSDAAEGRR